MEMPKEIADSLREAAAEMRPQFEAAGANVNQFCGCGDCQAHYDRAMKLMVDLVREGSCVKSVAQIAHALMDINGTLVVSVGMDVDKWEAKETTIHAAMTYRGMRNVEALIKLSGTVDEITRANRG